jgi:hypothetical protein
MAGLIEELKYEVDWRIDEITTLKTLHVKHKFTDTQKKITQKYSIPAFYSLWEGFVTTGFSIYIRYINQLNLPAIRLCKNIIVHDIDIKYNLGDGRKYFDKKISLVDNIYNYVNKRVNLRTQIPTESNVNFKVINDILSRFNLELLPNVPFNNDLDKLVHFRNNIAHGEVIHALDDILIDKLSITTMDLMYEVFSRIITGYQKQSYLHSPL